MTTLQNEFSWQFVRRPPLVSGMVSRPLEFMVSSIEADAKKVSKLHLFGATMAGQSVHCVVKGFHHYFWARAPEGFRPDKLPEYLQMWNAAMSTFGKEPPIHAIQVEMRESIVYYKGEDAKEPFLKIVLTEPRDLYTARKFFRGDLGVSIQLPGGMSARSLELFEEEGVDYVGRFMADKGITGYGWVSVEQFDASYESTCSFGISANAGHIRARTPTDDPKYSEIAPQRTFDFDIECYATTRAFPAPERDPIIQISVQVWETGSGGTKKILDAVLYTRETDHIGGETVMVQYSDENKLLRGFQTLASAADYDLSRSFNGRVFDWPYLFDRAKTLGVRSFGNISRLTGTPALIAAPSTFQSAARGTREYRDTKIPGRDEFDVCDICRREEKLKSYKLNSVAMAFLRKPDGTPLTKEDVHHSMITVLYDGTPQERGRLARYCRTDTELVRLIDAKRMYFLRYIEQARVNRVTMRDLVVRGQQIKVFMQLLTLAQEFKLVLPAKRACTPYSPEGQYEGALVLEPVVGFHTKPIACLDFSSLYPSECISENICYSTLLSPQDAVRLKRERPNDVFEGPKGHCFVRPSVRKGILCILEERLLAARKVAKNDMKAAIDAADKFRLENNESVAAAKEYEANVQDARQLAIKLSANSAYGFTGVSLTRGGLLACFEVAETITSCGQRDLLDTVSFVHKHYPDARVIYGDTDSVMVEPGCATVAEAMAWMHMVAARINKERYSSRSPMKLAPEKIMYPMLLQSKKHYCCGYYESTPDRPDKLYTKGIETIRRDACELMSNCLQTCLEMIFIQPEKPIKERVEEAVSHAKKTVQDLYLNKVEFHQLLITKSLSKNVDEYSSKQAHTVLAEKMARRDASTAPVVGDRIPYIMIGDGNKNVSDMAEDPLYALENEIPPNVDYYIENQLRNPLERLFVPIIGAQKTGDIFYGSHTRKRVRPVANLSKASKNSIMSFAIIKRTCGKCGEPYDPKVHKHPTLCKDCVCEHGGEAAGDKLRHYTEIKERYDEQFKICQSCQGSDRDPVLCMARDCPSLYRRRGLEHSLKKATIDIEDIAKMTSEQKHAGQI